MSRQTIKDRYDSAKTTVRRDLLTKSVIKATTEEEIPPKDKHLTALESFTRNTFTSMPDFVSALQLRLTSSNWLVVAKSLMTIHHLLINGEERFALYLTSNLSIFSNLFHFPDLIVKQNQNIIDFLNSYVNYLKAKLETYYKLGFDITKSATCLNFDDKAIKDLLPICKNMNYLATSIFDTQIHKHSFSSKMLLFIFNLIYVDVSKLYCCYNNVLTIMLKSFYKTDKKSANNILSEFENYLSHQSNFSILFDSAKEHLGISDSVKVTLIDKKIFDEMKSHLNSNNQDKSFMNMNEEIPQKKPQNSGKSELEDLFFNDNTTIDIHGQSAPNHEDNFGFSLAENSTFTQNFGSNQPVPSQNFDMFAFDPVQNSTPPQQYGQLPHQAPPMQLPQVGFHQECSNPVEPSWMDSVQFQPSVGSVLQQPQSMQQPSNSQSLFSQMMAQPRQSNIQNPTPYQTTGTQLFSNPMQPPMQNPMQNPMQPAVQNSMQNPMMNPMLNPMQPPMQNPMMNPMINPMQPPMQNPIMNPMQPPMQPLMMNPMQPPMQNSLQNQMQPQMQSQMAQSMAQPFGGQNMMGQGGLGGKNGSSKDPFDFFSI